MASKKRLRISKLGLVLAAVVLLPLVVVGAYFGSRLLKAPALNGSAGPESAGAGGRTQVEGNPDQWPPEVEGPVLGPSDEPRGEVVSGPLTGGAPRTRYKVKPGDTLSQIIAVHYGDSSYMQDVLRANPGLNPSRIYAGQELILPPKTAPAESAAQAEQPKIYIVQPRDTLIGIARRLYGDSAMYVQIYELNRDRLSSPEALREGMVLRLPPRPTY